MRKVVRVAAIVFPVLAVLTVLSFFTWLPSFAAAVMNRAESHGPYAVNANARDLHASLRVVDLHSDLLLWPRDPLRRSKHGHTDVPRLLDGNVALQVFSVVTKVPVGMNYERNAATSDQLTALVVASRWPRRTWSSLMARALYQARRLDTAARESGGELVIVRSRRDLEDFLAARVEGAVSVAGLLALEGMHAFEGRMEGVDSLADAGFRMMGFTHFFDNEVAGSAHGVTKGGLTEFGRRVVERLEDRGILLDLAHASSATIADVLLMATNPVVVSHTGVQATCPGPRNLSDDQIRAVARNGGVIGVGFWSGAVCDSDPAAIVEAVRHVRDLVGVEHVALGSDFDGSVWTAFDASGLALITHALLTDGFAVDEIRAVMGENALRVLLEVLP
jgi:microsomal dipeptidase-like Zn-dependent dipeptidase